MNVDKYKELKDKFYKNLKNSELYNNYSVYDQSEKLLTLCKYHFLENDVYIYSILVNLEIIINTDFPTACLTYEEKADTKFKVYINPYFFLFMNSLHFEFALFLLLHEVYHFLMSHLFSRHGNESNKDRKIKNIAQDLAINSIIIVYFDQMMKMNPEFFPIPKVGNFKDFPNYLSYEQYEDLLLKQQKETGKPPPGETVDEHEENDEGENSDDSGNDNGNNEGSKHLKSDKSGIGSIDGTEQSDQLKNIEKEEILDKCGLKPGKYTSNTIRGMITARENKEKLNPKLILSYFIQKCSIKYSKRNSFRKVNKKYVNQFPGRKVTRKPRIAIFVDQSGSVSDALLSRFFTLIDQLHCELSMFDVIPFDYVVDVNNIQKVKGFKRVKKERTKTGGTNFQAVIDYANISKYDGIIILTDLGCSIPGPSKMTRIWISDVNTPKFGNDINLTL